MSILKTTNLEDLLNSITNDARKVAQTTVAQDQDDLVSDKDREKDDGEAQQAINTALKTGEVHQEAKEVNAKAFMTRAEQTSFMHHLSLKSMTNPMTGEAIYSDRSLVDLCAQASNFQELEGVLVEILIQSRNSTNEIYSKALKAAHTKAMNLEADSVQLLLWRTLTSRLQPVM